MSLLSEFRSRARHVIGPIVGIAAVGYFAFHAVNGDRGLLALRKLRIEVVKVRKLARDIALERRTLENRVRLLEPRSLDPDMLEERARIMLNYGYPDEVVILYKKPGGAK
jgi:cell division protein FtsB